MSNPKEWYKHINTIIGNKRHNLNLINIPEVAFRPISEQITIINSHFANICKMYPHLNKEIILNEMICNNSITIFSEFEDYKLFKKY